MDPADSARRRFALTLDARDVLGVAGAGLVVVGACAIHWALGLVAVGLGLCAAAWRLSRPA